MFAQTKVARNGDRIRSNYTGLSPIGPQTGGAVRDPFYYEVLVFGFTSLPWLLRLCRSFLRRCFRRPARMTILLMPPR
jgi:hypothetical protein